MRRELIATFVWLSGCGPVETTPADAGVVEVDAGVTLGDAGTLVGTFQVTHLAGTDSTASFVGRVFDGPTPATLIWTKALEEGDCALLTPRVPFCATPCGSAAACVADGVCQRYPTTKAAGTLHVTGVRTTSGTTELDVTVVANVYQPVGVTLEKPPFQDGAPVVVTASGSTAVIPFRLETVGVAPMVLSTSSVTVERSQALPLTWTPGLATTAARVTVSLDISHHGGTKGEIRCDTADDGSLSISSALITRLLDLGVAGFPSIVVRRERVGSALVAQGRVDLLVASEEERAVTIPGLISCSSNDDCTAPLTCQPDLRCQ